MGLFYGSVSASRMRHSTSFVEFFSRVRVEGFVRSPFKRFCSRRFFKASQGSLFKRLFKASRPSIAVG